SLMGINDAHPMIGRDISKESPDAPGRAMMQFEQHYGWMEGTEMVVLRPGKSPAAVTYDPIRKTLEPVKENERTEDMARRALAHVQLPSWLYHHQKYRM